MKNKLQTKEQLQEQARIQAEKGGTICAWDIVYFTNVYDEVPPGTIHDIMKLYDPRNDTLRISFCFHTSNGFHDEFIENAEDICCVFDLLRMGSKIYKEKVSKLKFTPQPAWND